MKTQVQQTALWAGAVVALLAALPGTGAAQGERHELSGDAVAVYNLAGDVTIEAIDGAAVRVTVERRGADGARLEVAKGRIDGAQTLRVLYPADAIRFGDGGGRMELRVREDGTFGNGSGGRRVTISGDRGDFEASADLTIGVPAGQTIRVHLAAGSVAASNVSGDLMIDTHSADVTTRATRGPLHIDVGSGEIAVSEAEGDVTLDTGSGDVSVRDVRGDELYIDTGSGSVTAAAVAVRDLTIDTGSGNVEVTGGSARSASIDTGSGSVELHLSNSPEEVMVDTGSGSVTVRVPDSFSARVEIETSSGDIDLEFPLQVSDWERNHVTGTIGSGDGRLTVETGSGSVALLKSR
jgi:DUF4097 and DUF4098 domain-containing protein YvlB